MEIGKQGRRAVRAPLHRGVGAYVVPWEEDLHLVARSPVRASASDPELYQMKCGFQLLDRDDFSLLEEAAEETENSSLGRHGDASRYLLPEREARARLRRNSWA